MRTLNQSVIRALVGPAEDRQEWTLTPELAKLHATVQRLHNALQTIPEAASIHTVRDTAIAAALTAEDPAVLDVTAVLNHERAVAEYDARVDILQTALDRASADLNGYLTENADDIIVTVLQPALDALWPKVTTAAKPLAGLDTNNRNALLTATDKQRRAYLDFDGLAGRYNRLREAWSRLRPAGQLQHDAHHDHAEFQAGLCSFWPAHKASAVNVEPRAPWPLEARDRLLWIARHNLTPWLPTATQQDAAWMAAHRDQHEAAQNQRSRQQQALAYTRAFNDAA